MKKVVFRQLLIWCLSGLGASTPLIAHADNITLKQDRPESYLVVKGDTLWDISERFLQDPWKWKEVWQANSQIENPHLIYPGDIIRLVFIDGKPRLTIDRLNEPQPVPIAQTTAVPTPKNKAKGPLKTVKLSPKIYSTPIKKAINSIPLEKINSFLVGNRIVDVDVLPNAPHVVAGPEKRVILGAGDVLYARGNFSDVLHTYGIYRPGQQYIDPETKKVLGIQAIEIGTASIRAKNGELTTFAITNSIGEIRAGDRLLPTEERQITSIFEPIPPTTKVDGLIMTVERGISKAGKLDIVAVNVGRNQKLEQGHILAIHKQGETVTDRYAKRKTKKRVTLPDQREGLVLIFQTFKKMSLGIVLQANNGLNVKDLVRTP